MRRNLLLIAAALGIILSVTFMIDRGAVPASPPVAVPKEITEIKARSAPDFEFRTMKDKSQQRLSDFRGKVVLLNFWASWCAPCIIEFPKLEELAHLYDGQLIVIAVSADSAEADITKFLKKIRHAELDHMLIVPDTTKAISQDLFQTIKLPETIIIDPAGRMVRKVVGDTDWTGTDMRSYLSSLAAPPAIP